MPCGDSASFSNVIPRVRTERVAPTPGPDHEVEEAFGNGHTANSLMISSASRRGSASRIGDRSLDLGDEC
jgi:hypothetical protein